MRKAGDIVTALFKAQYGPAFMETAQSNAFLFSSWNEVVAEVWPLGIDQKKEDVPAAAVHSRIRELERGVLLVEADHPGWIQLLQTKQADLLSTVQRRYPELGIRLIAFRLSREPLQYPGHNTEKIVNARDPEPDQQINDQQLKQEKLKDVEFVAALEGLEKSFKKRNGL